MIATEIYLRIYEQYGTDTGILFGIPATHKTAVLAVVECVLDMLEEEEDRGARSPFSEQKEQV